jgi:hypothetical protein
MTTDNHQSYQPDQPDQSYQRDNPGLFRGPYVRPDLYPTLYPPDEQQEPESLLERLTETSDILSAAIDRIDALERRCSEMEQLLIRSQNRTAIRHEDLYPTLPAPMPPAAHSSIVEQARSLSAPPPPDPTWIPIIHRPEAQGCGKPAQYLIHRIHPVTPASKHLLRISPPSSPDRRWRIPESSDIACCSSCAAPVDPHSGVDLDWTPAFDPTLPLEYPSRRITVVTPEAEAEQRSLLDHATDISDLWGLPPHG